MGAVNGVRDGVVFVNCGAVMDAVSGVKDGVLFKNCGAVMDAGMSITGDGCCLFMSVGGSMSKSMR